MFRMDCSRRGIWRRRRRRRKTKEVPIKSD
jgi:hypothetical protein